MWLITGKEAEGKGMRWEERKTENRQAIDEAAFAPSCNNSCRHPCTAVVYQTQNIELQRSKCQSHYNHTYQLMHAVMRKYCVNSITKQSAAENQFIHIHKKFFCQKTMQKVVVKSAHHTWTTCNCVTQKTNTSRYLNEYNTPRRTTLD